MKVAQEPKTKDEQQAKNLRLSSYICPICQSYMARQHYTKQGTRYEIEYNMCGCPPVYGLVWRNDSQRQGRYYHNRWLWMPNGKSQLYHGQRSPGRWINVHTDEPVAKPDWMRWLKVPIIIDRSSGREFKALVEIEGEQRLVDCIGTNRPGLYHALCVNPPVDYWEGLPGLSAKRLAMYKEKLRVVNKHLVIVPKAHRKRYARTPHAKGVTLTTIHTKDQGRGKYEEFIPRWSVREFGIEKWQFVSKDVIEDDGKKRETILRYKKPHESDALIGQQSGANAWCHTPIHPCEWETDPRQGYKAVRAHLDDYGFEHLHIDWIQRRFLFYTSDGNRKTQVGQIKHPDPMWGSAKRILLWADECWAMQLSAQADNGVWRMVTPGMLFVADDMTFIATYQCLRIGQSLTEYRAGINLYAPHAAPMSLADFITGPLSDYWDSKGNIKLIRPQIQMVRAKEVATTGDLQKALLDKIQKKYEGFLLIQGWVISYVTCPLCGYHLHHLVYDKEKQAIKECSNCGKAGIELSMEATTHFITSEGPLNKVLSKKGAKIA